MRHFLAALALTVSPAAAQEVAMGEGAVLRGLDKISGELTDLQITSGEVVEYGRLLVQVTQCRYPADNPASDAFAHVKISEARDGAVQFYGWMIASSPALNALDHARYDVWLIRCEVPQRPAVPESESTEDDGTGDG